MRGDLIAALATLAEDKGCQARARDLYALYEKDVTAVDRNMVPALIAMTFLYGLNVLVRAAAPAYASALAWIDEAARYLLVWVVFLAAGITLEVGRQVSVDVIRGRLRAAHERALFALIDAVGVVFCLGAALFYVLLFRSRIVPRWITVGVVGGVPLPHPYGHERGVGRGPGR